MSTHVTGFQSFIRFLHRFGNSSISVQMGFAPSTQAISAITPPPPPPPSVTDRGVQELIPPLPLSMLCMCLCVNVVRAVFVRDFALLMERANRLREGVVGQALFGPVAFPHSFNIIQSIAQPHRASASSSSPDQPDRWQVFSSGPASSLNYLVTCRRLVQQLAWNARTNTIHKYLQRRSSRVNLPPTPLPIKILKHGDPLYKFIMITYFFENIF